MANYQIIDVFEQDYSLQGKPVFLAEKFRDCIVSSPKIDEIGKYRVRVTVEVEPLKSALSTAQSEGDQ